MVNVSEAAKGVADGSGALAKDSKSVEFSFTGTDSSLQSRLTTPEAYIHYQDSLPKEKRDGYVARLFRISEIKIKKRINEDGTEAFQQLIHSFLKNFPKLLFISLPIMALILNLIFFRKKSFSYVSHVIFLLHLYVFTLVVLLIVYVFIQLNSWTNWSIFNWLAVITQLWILYYGYRSMRNLYQTSKWKGRLQYLTFLFSGMIIVFLLFLGGILYTILSV